ncbi:MAG TPA: hypothetical protein VKA04_03765, partial [Pseudodesulfovibrio sp.]|nr:hypothetical protein [Pseudodesulfovibrio sp.]
MLRVRIPADLPKLPCVTQRHRWCNRILQDTVYEPLVRWSPRKERFEPVLATSWKRLEKGLVFQLTLRDKVLWHNGEPLQA